MSAAWIPSRSAEVRPRQFPPGSLMAFFVGYGDESGKQDDPQSTCSAYGIVSGPAGCWDAFDQEWNEALGRAGIDWFHRKDFGKPNGPYVHLDDDAQRRLYQDLIKAVEGAGLELYASAVRHPALAQFNQRTGLCLDAYALSLYACLIYIWFEHPEGEITLYLDWVEKQANKLACVEDYVMTSQLPPEFSGWFDEVGIHRAPKGGGRLARTPGYQAADFLAWEVRKYVHTDPRDERHRKDVDGLVLYHRDHAG
jgi:hypothetical protein